MVTAGALEPYAAKVVWRSEAPRTSEEWGKLLARFLEELATRTVERGAVLVGHIKGIAKPEAGGYLHVSVVSAAHAASVQGEVADGLTTMPLDLNVLVYGLPRSVVASVVEEAARTQNGSIAVESLGAHAHFDGLHPSKSGR